MAKLVSATYGDALFEVAMEQNMVDALFEEAKAVHDALGENKELIDLLNHPKIDKAKKVKTIEDIFNQFVSKELTGLMVTVVNKDRGKDLQDILEYFLNKVKEHKKIGTAYVTTPMELSKEAKKKVEQRLLETTGYVKFEMIYAVDESLIGGMVIRIGDRVVDSSIKHKLSELSRQLNKIDV